MNENSAEIIFVGTSSGQTSAARNHSSIFIRTNEQNLLVDAGDGIAKALLIQNINYDEIHSILFTHYHADHFAGIASLITQMEILKRKHPLKIFTHINLISQLKSLLNSVYMFKESLGFELRIIGFSFDEKVQVNNKIKFTAKQNSHLRRKEHHKNYPEDIFVSSSLLLEIDEQKIFYTSDIGSGNDLFLFGNYEIDYLITEACHININDIYKFISTKNPGNIFITHYDNEYEAELQSWKNSLKDSEKQRITICYDGLSFSI